MTMEKKLAIGIDIGGSHITSALVDMDAGKIVPDSAATEPVDAKASAEKILGQWAKAIAATLVRTDRGQLAGIGFAMPGPFEYETGIARFERVQKYEGLFGVNVTDELRLRLGLDETCPCRYMNDATAFAVGEAWLGKAADVDRAMAITLGTGFGSAFIGRGVPVVDGPEVPPMGCVWHLPYKDGIADDSFSTRWFVKAYRERSGKTVGGAREIEEAARTDPLAAAVYEEFYANLGRFLEPHLRTFGARVLVIGGNVAGSFPRFGHILTGVFRETRLPVEVRLSELKETAAIIGGARLLDGTFWEKVAPLVSKM